MKKLIPLLILLTACSSEEHRKHVNCEYPGGIILQNYHFKESGLGNQTYDIQYKQEVYRFVDVYDIDSYYKEGDTINKPCLTN